MAGAPKFLLCASFVACLAGSTRAAELDDTAKMIQRGSDVFNLLRGQYGEVLNDHIFGWLGDKVGSAVSEKFIVRGLVSGATADMLNPPWFGYTDVFYTGDREAFQEFHDRKLAALHEELPQYRAILASRMAQLRSLHSGFLKSTKAYEAGQRTLDSLKQSNAAESIRISEAREQLRQLHADLLRLENHPEILRYASSMQHYSNWFHVVADRERYQGAARDSEAYLQRTGELPPEPPIPYCLNDHHCAYTCSRARYVDQCNHCKTGCDRMSLAIWRGITECHNQISRAARSPLDTRDRFRSELAARESALEDAESRLSTSTARESTLAQELQRKAQTLREERGRLEYWTEILANFKRTIVDPAEKKIRMDTDCSLFEYVGWKTPLCEISGIGYDHSGRVPRDPQRRPTAGTTPSSLVQPRIESFSAWADAVDASNDGSTFKPREGFALPDIEPLQAGRDPVGDGPRFINAIPSRLP
jgi:hypothetical protein